MFHEKISGRRGTEPFLSCSVPNLNFNSCISYEMTIEQIKSSLTTWLSIYDTHAAGDTQYLFVGCKHDLATTQNSTKDSPKSSWRGSEKAVIDEYMVTLAEEKGTLYFPVSAKTNFNVDAMFLAAVTIAARVAGAHKDVIDVSAQSTVNGGGGKPGRRKNCC